MTEVIQSIICDTYIQTGVIFTHRGIKCRHISVERCFLHITHTAESLQYELVKVPSNYRTLRFIILLTLKELLILLL